MAMILDGKETAAALKEELALRLAKLREKHYEPKLAIIPGIPGAHVRALEIAGEGLD